MKPLGVSGDASLGRRIKGTSWHTEGRLPLPLLVLVVRQAVHHLDDAVAAQAGTRRSAGPFTTGGGTRSWAKYGVSTRQCKFSAHGPRLDQRQSRLSKKDMASSRGSGAHTCVL